uniref:Dynein axonemal assembly factor 4 n=1 Tax=Graphocephala atropunctata TaxID=36148 RepID=A0A1B6KSX5_9HEMI
MPILIKDYNWRQTEELVIIYVPLKGVSVKNIDIFTSSCYLKIHSPPFLFEVCLWQPVVESECSCTVVDGEATFRLVKKLAASWPQLAADLSRQEALQVKTRAIEEVQTKAEICQKEKSAKKNERQRTAVKEQISLNTREQQDIERTKRQEKEAALTQMGWGRQQSSVRITEIVDTQGKTTTKKIDQDIFKVEKKEVKEMKSLIPAPRQVAQIPVTFTARWFPTPSRESMVSEEQEWLRKRAEAMRRTGFVAEDLRPEEQDPLWLCDKAQSFYDVGNYLGAVSAYSHALTLNDQLYELYAGRAKAHLALGNVGKAATDSSKALELLTPPVPQNAEARAQCLLSRGLALTGLNLQSEALGELQAAELLMPTCLDIKAAIEQLHKDLSEVKDQ